MFRIQTSSLGLINQSSLQNAPNPNLFSPKEVYNDYDEEPNAAPKSYRNNMILATSSGNKPDNYATSKAKKLQSHRLKSAHAGTSSFQYKSIEML
jgi:hypothetical protein